MQEPPRTARTRPAWRLGCGAGLVVLLVGGLGLAWWGLRPDVGPLVYPGAQAQAGVPAQGMGLYGLYETSDSVDAVAAWYAGRGLVVTHESLGGRPSTSGSRGALISLPLAGLGHGLLLGRTVHYRAVAQAGRTVISLWCDPPCAPGDPVWSGLSVVP